MSRFLLWLSILVALPGVAGADPPGPPDRQAVLADTRADATRDGEPALDLSFEPALAPPPSGPAEPARSRAAAGQAAAEAPVTFGLVITTRREVGDEARQSGDAQTLTDEVTGLVKRSTFGLSGTYHF